MNKDKLISELNNMYKNAGQGDAVATIHLFGIKYSEYIGRDKVATSQEIAEKSFIPDSYFAEINKGKKLSKFVLIK